MLTNTRTSEVKWSVLITITNPPLLLLVVCYDSLQEKKRKLKIVLKKLIFLLKKLKKNQWKKELVKEIIASLPTTNKCKV